MSDFVLYWDLDGVYADYDGGIRAFGMSPDPSKKNDLNRSGSNDPFKREMYERIKGSEFYRTLPIMPNAVEMLKRSLAIAEPIFLTASPKFGASEDDYFLNPHWLGAAYHKRIWVEETLMPRVHPRAVTAYDPETENMVATYPRRVPVPDDAFICTTSARKHEFMGRRHGRHQILIDDRRDNCVRWARAGGVAILHLAPVLTTEALGVITSGDHVGDYFHAVPGGGLIAGLEDVRTWDEIDAAATRND